MGQNQPFRALGAGMNAEESLSSSAKRQLENGAPPCANIN